MNKVLIPVPGNLEVIFLFVLHYHLPKCTHFDRKRNVRVPVLKVDYDGSFSSFPPLFTAVVRLNISSSIINDQIWAPVNLE